MKPSEAIREARNLLFEDGWVQKRYGNSTEGRCLRAALAEVAVREGVISGLCGSVPAAWQAPVCAVIGEDSDAALPGLLWNDAPGRTFDEVIDAFDRAEKLALIAEESDG